MERPKRGFYLLFFSICLIFYLPIKIVRNILDIQKVGEWENIYTPVMK